MIYTHEHFLDDLSILHPEVEKQSLELIVRKGLQGINRVLRSGQELVLHNYQVNGKTDDWIKFFIYMSPADQNKHALKQFYKKQRKKQLDGEK